MTPHPGHIISRSRGEYLRRRRPRPARDSQEPRTMINVSTSAASKITELLVEEGKENSGLRVFVQGGGCSGFQYGLMIEEGGGEGDQVFESNGVKLFVDPVS